MTNTPDVLTDATADLAFSLLACVARRVVADMDYVRQGRWTSWRPGLLLGQDGDGAGEEAAKAQGGGGAVLSPCPHSFPSLAAKYAAGDKTSTSSIC